MCVCFFFLFKKKKIEHHWWCDFGAWNWKTTVGVAAKFQMSINLEASMWDTSIKVSVRLMLLPASWHSMTIWKRGCFLYPWPTAPVERIGGGRREGRCVCRRGWGGYKSITLFTSHSVWAKTLLRVVKTRRQRRAAETYKYLDFVFAARLVTYHIWFCLNRFDRFELSTGEVVGVVEWPRCVTMNQAGEEETMSMQEESLKSLLSTNYNPIFDKNCFPAIICIYIYTNIFTSIFLSCMAGNDWLYNGRLLLGKKKNLLLCLLPHLNSIITRHKLTTRVLQ